MTFTNGRYTYVCDPHATQMEGSFIAGTGPPAPAATPKLVATVGPRAAITLRNATGGIPRGLRAGVYTIVVRDRSKSHNFHLAGPGVNRKTAIARTGTFTWKVRLTRGTLRFSLRTPPRSGSPAPFASASRGDWA